MSAGDETTDPSLIETENIEVQEVASSSIPEDMEGAVIESPGQDVYPAYVAYAAGASFAAGFGSAAVSNVTDAINVFSVEVAADPTQVPTSKGASVDDLLDAHEQTDD